MTTIHTYDRTMLDPRDPFFTGIIRHLASTSHALTGTTVARHNGFAVPAVRAALDTLLDEGLTTPARPTVAGTVRWKLTDWGHDWARVVAERHERLRTRHLGRPYHYADARDGANNRPSEEHWCDWCAGFYGVPHDICDAPGPGGGWATHQVGVLGHKDRRGVCACIDCATLRNDRTILAHRP